MIFSTLSPPGKEEYYLNSVILANIFWRCGRDVSIFTTLNHVWRTDVYKLYYLEYLLVQLFSN